MNDITLLGIGDILIDRPNPKTIFVHVSDMLAAADITFAQLEQNYSDKGYPVGVSPTYSDPRNIPALSHIGLDIGSLAGNHTVDWGTEALLDTMRRLREAGIATLGVGKDVDEAHQPVFLDRKGSRVAFLGYGCIGPDGYEAGEDKPGYAAMRAWTLYKQFDYQPGTPPAIMTFPHKEDLETMIKDIKNLRARSDVDVLIVSFHWGVHFVPAVIPTYEIEVGHAAIDAGADLILGHHAHMLKGIEVYKGKVIFHSLGNFALELNPTWRGQKHVHSIDYITKVVGRYGFKPDPDFPHGILHPDGRMTMIAKVIISKGKVNRVSYVPCYINKNAEPEIQRRESEHAKKVFAYVKKISREQNLNVHFSWDGDEVLISA